MSNAPEQIGVKHDKEKPDWALLPFTVITEIVKVLTFGKSKYDRDNWKFVDEPENRYFSACLRHLSAWKQGELTDSESGLHHLSHACCCLIFLIWFDLHKTVANDNPPFGADHFKVNTSDIERALEKTDDKLLETS